MMDYLVWEKEMYQERLNLGGTCKDWPLISCDIVEEGIKGKIGHSDVS